LFCHFQVVPAEASAEVTQNSGDGAEAAAPISASSPKKIKRSVSLARPFHQKTNISTIIIIIMFKKGGWACCLFLNPPGEVGPPISSSVVLCSFVHLVCNAVLVLVVYFWANSAKGAHPYRKACRSRGIKVAAPPLDSPCDGPVTYPGNNKAILEKSSRVRIKPNISTKH